MMTTHAPEQLHNHVPRTIAAAAVLLLFSAGPASAADVKDAMDGWSATGGNYAASGSIDLRSARRQEVKLPAEPRWITGFSTGEALRWYVLLSDERVMQIEVDRRGRVVTEMSAYRYPQESKLVLQPGGDDGGAVSSDNPLFPPSAYHGNFDSPPTPLPGGGYAAIDRHGRLRVVRGGQSYVVEGIRPLPDSQLLVDPDGRLLVLTDPDRRYTHGILGDEREAAGFAVVDTGGGTRPPRVEAHTLINEIAQRADSGTEALVAETLQPLWGNLSGDGRVEELFLTVSGLRKGARLWLINTGGSLLAESTPIGRGFRWIHRLAYAPLGPDGEMELAAVRTPHIGGVLEYYRLQDDRLKRVHAERGFSTHRIGSRNLATALAGDFLNLGRAGLLLPLQSMRELAVVYRTSRGADLLHRIPLSGAMSTNLAHMAHQGRTALALGTAKKRVHLFYSPPRGSSATQ